MPLPPTITKVNAPEQFESMGIPYFPTIDGGRVTINNDDYVFKWDAAGHIPSRGSIRRILRTVPAFAERYYQKPPAPTSPERVALANQSYWTHFSVEFLDGVIKAVTAARVVAVAQEQASDFATIKALLKKHNTSPEEFLTAPDK